MFSTIMGMLAEKLICTRERDRWPVQSIFRLPVRKITDYPVIVGSSLKGALLDAAKQHQKAGLTDIKTERVFGSPNQAGAIAVTDGRLLLLPIRSLNSHYKWVTCPYLLERYQRDCGLAGIQVETIDFQPLKKLREAETAAAGEGRLYLEDSHFKIVSTDLITPVAEAIAPLIKHPSVKQRLPENLVIVNDNEFVFFARYALAVNARNLLDEQKISQNLWYEETIPSDTLFYTLFLAPPGRKRILFIL
jgi:CRISPR-associated protein Cmr4